MMPMITEAEKQNLLNQCFTNGVKDKNIIKKTKSWVTSTVDYVDNTVIAE